MNMREWIPVEERLPDEKFQDVLVFERGRDKATQARFHPDGKFIRRRRTLNVTHWMPLPEPPEGTDEPPSYMYM